jgi:hypothetical protein
LSNAESAMSAADFEARYRADPDPWGYTHSVYERDKYAATLEACGPGRFTCALELGGSIGVFSSLLAPRCRRLVTIDAAPSAVVAARRRLACHPHAEAILGSIPGDVPDRRYDLVVASEILYYLTVDVVADTLAVLDLRMLPGARLVAVHWRPHGPERPLDADQVHATLRARPSFESLGSGATDDYLLDVLERR